MEYKPWFVFHSLFTPVTKRVARRFCFWAFLVAVDLLWFLLLIFFFLKSTHVFGVFFFYVILIFLKAFRARILFYFQ
jgi:hypothetical protein